jgi:hypothetical protein
VTITVLAGGILAFMATFAHTRHLSNRGEAQAVEVQVAEQELQRIVSLGYSNIGLSSTPTHSSNPSDPNFYVQNTSPATFQWDRGNSANVEQLCTGTTSCTGSLSPGPTAWSSGGHSGSIYRYITWVDDTCSACNASTRDYKRVTLMFTETGVNAPTTPFLISTVVADPNAGPGP